MKTRTELASRVADRHAFGEPIKPKKTVRKDDINVVKTSHWTDGSSSKTILHLEMKGTHYLAIFESGSGLQYGIEAKGNKSQVERAYQYEIQKSLNPIGGRTTRTWEQAPDDPAKVNQIIDTFVHPTWGFSEEQWGVTPHGDDNTFTDDFEEKEFHRLLKDQLKGWKGGGFGTLVQNHPYWKTFHSMIQEAVKKKYGSRIRLYRGIWGKQAYDILNGAPVKVNPISAWAVDKDAAMVYRRVQKRDYWVVVRGVFKAKDIMFAPVVLPDFIDPNILLVFGRDVEHTGDELVVHTPSGRVNAEVIMKTKKKMASTRYDAKPRFRRGQVFKTEAGSELALERIHTHPTDADYVDSVEFTVKSIAPEDVRGRYAFFYERPEVGDKIKIHNQDLGAIGWPRVRYEPTFHAASRVAAKYKNKKQVDKADGSGKTTVYEYSKGQVQYRNREKAKRIEKLKSQIGKLRSQLKSDLKNDDPKIKLTALAVCLMDQTCARVGNEKSVKDRGHFGVTTLQAKHVNIRGGKATLTYKGKSGVEHKKTVSDASTVKALKDALKGKSGSDTILCEGDDCTVRAADVNKYLKKYDVTAKDIRGFRANDEMVRQLDKHRKGKLPEDKKEREKKLKEEFDAALKATAEVVGHEPSTLKNQYLVPKMEDQYKGDGTVMKKWDKKAFVRKATNQETEDFLTAVAKLKVMAKDGFDEGKFGLRQINLAWYELITHGEVISNDILENKMIPKRDAKGFEMAYRLFANSRKMPGLKRRYLFNRDVFGRWWDKNEKRFDLIVRAIREWGDKSENADAVFPLGSFTIHNVLGAEGSDLEGFKKAVTAAEKFIKANGSVVPNFRKVLYGEIFYVPQLTKAHHIAWYDWSKDKVYVRKNKAAWGKSEVHSLIHELGHRYWRKFSDRETQFKWKRHYNRVSYERPEVPDLKEGDQLPLRVRGAKRGWRPKVLGVMGSEYIYLTPEGEGRLDFLKTVHPPATTSREDFETIWEKEMRENPRVIGNIDRKKVNDHRGKTEDGLTAYPTPYSRSSPEEHFCEALALNCMGTLDQKHKDAFTDIWTQPVSNEELRARGRVASKWLLRTRVKKARTV